MPNEDKPKLNRLKIVLGKIIGRVNGWLNS